MLILQGFAVFLVVAALTSANSAASIDDKPPPPPPPPLPNMMPPRFDQVDKLLILDSSGKWNHVIDMPDPGVQSQQCDVGTRFVIYRPGASGGLMYIPEPALVFCGGLYGGASDICYEVIWDANTKSRGRLSKNRVNAGATVVNDGKTLFFTGGRAPDRESGVAEYSDFSLAGAPPESSPGPKLPVPLEHHCMVELKDGTVWIIGGSKVSEPGSVSKKTYYLSACCDIWQPGPDLLIARQNPTCGVVKDPSNPDGIETIVVVGGKSESGSGIYRVELISPTKDNYEKSPVKFGPALPAPFS